MSPIPISEEPHSNPLAPVQSKLWAPATLFAGSIVLRDRSSLYFTIGGCAISSLVAVFQFAVFTSFLRVSYAAIEFIGADAWIVSRGVQAFDFPYPISRDYAEMLTRCFPNASLVRVACGFTTWQSPHGKRGNVAVVGYDGAPVDARGFVADSSDLARLDLTLGLTGEIGEITSTFVLPTDRLATFLGAPYIVTSYGLAASALRLPRDRASFIAIRSRPGESDLVPVGTRCAEALAPDIDAMTSREFQYETARYWLFKTGAGAAILIAALLASLLNVLILSNGVTRFVQRYHQALMSIRGHGGGFAVIHLICFLIGTVIVGASSMISLALLPLADAATAWLVPWVSVGTIDLGFALLLALSGLSAGYFTAVAQSNSVDLREIFRT